MTVESTARMSGIVAILTDFGTLDTYVGAMKAVMLGIHPRLQLVDITHAIPPGSVREGAFALLNSYRYFPAGTVFCVVVDPGVGSARLPMAVAAGRYIFVGPDNGALGYALDDIGDEREMVALEHGRYRLQPVSQTFHGRDIFAPAAAHLAKDPSLLPDMGSARECLIKLPPPHLSYARKRLTGEVMHIDRFGNIITSIGLFSWGDEGQLRLTPMWRAGESAISIAADAAHITIHSHTIHGISRAYHQAPRGTILAQIDSNGFLEIGANQDDAAARLDIQPGDKVMLRLSP